MTYPMLIIDKQKLKHNTRLLIERCGARGVDVTAVTKCYCGIAELAEAQIDAGSEILADSRIENLKKMEKLHAAKLLIRIPMISQAEDVVRYADISMNSEISVIKELSKEAKKQNKIHKIILMIDIGDLREGILENDADSYIKEILSLDNIKLYGIGANFSCFGGVMPEEKNLQVIANIAKKAMEKYGADIKLVSGGNSVTYEPMKQGIVPAGINHFRLGEIILLGYDSVNEIYVDDAFYDVFTLRAEVIELKEKPSQPFGIIGKDAFGNVPYFEDIGIRKRAILGIGKQDVKIEDLTPNKPGIEVLGGSSDHMILDVTDYQNDLKVGDTLDFRMTYGALLAVSTSEYVSKNIIN